MSYYGRNKTEKFFNKNNNNTEERKIILFFMEMIRGNVEFNNAIKSLRFFNNKLHSTDEIINIIKKQLYIMLDIKVGDNLEEFYDILTTKQKNINQCELFNQTKDAFNNRNFPSLKSMFFDEIYKEDKSSFFASSNVNDFKKDITKQLLS